MDPSGHITLNDNMGVVVLDNPSYLSESDRGALEAHNKAASARGAGMEYVHESGGGGGDSGDPWNGQDVVDLQKYGVEPSYLSQALREQLVVHNAVADLLGAIRAAVDAYQAVKNATWVPKIPGGLASPDWSEIEEAQRQYNMGITRATSGWVSLADKLPGPDTADYITYSVSISGPFFTGFTVQLTKGRYGQVYLGYGVGVGLSLLPVNATVEKGVLLGGKHDEEAVDALITDVCLSGNVVPVFGRGGNWSPAASEGSFEVVVGTPQAGANLTWTARMR